MTTRTAPTAMPAAKPTTSALPAPPPHNGIPVRPGTHLLGLANLDAAALRRLLSASAQHIPALGTPSNNQTLAGKVVANLFFEDSTRTRVSFTIAAQRLGAHVVDLASAGSSVSKGESLADTVHTVDAMGPSVLVVRHREAGAADIAAREATCPVINAGDGAHEHPTQGLIDALTLAEATGRLDTFDFTGLRVAIVGDVISSRVARSTAAALTTLGAQVVFVGPPVFCPPTLAGLAERPGTNIKLPEGAITIEHDLDAVLPEVDAAVMLRVQFERHTDGAPTGAHVAGTPTVAAAPKLASVRDYAAAYQLSPDRAKAIASARTNNGNTTGWILHPGPMNRGIEIHPDAADADRSLVRRQVALGVAVRMAALAHCAGV